MSQADEILTIEDTVKRLRVGRARGLRFLNENGLVADVAGARRVVWRDVVTALSRAGAREASQGPTRGPTRATKRMPRVRL